MFDRSQIARLIIRQRWSKACKLLKTRRGKEQAQEFPHQGFGYNLLSLALIEGPPVKLIKRLLAADPLASQRPDESFYGLLPLHVACCFGASNDVIKLLLNHDEQRRSASIVDSNKNTPLHLIGYYMCNKSCGGSEDRGECSTTMGTCGILSTMNLQDLQRSIEDLALATPHLIHARNDQNKTFIDILEDFKNENASLSLDVFHFVTSLRFFLLRVELFPSKDLKHHCCDETHRRDAGFNQHFVRDASSTESCSSFDE